MVTILVTCVGSGVGQSVIDSLNLLREYRIIGCDTNRNVYANHFCDNFHTVPSIYAEEYVDYILNLCIQEKVDVVVPGHDHELSLLSKNIAQFEARGMKVIVSLQDLIEISRDKYEWYNYFKAYGCPVVPTFRVGEFKKNPDMNIFPAIIKPSGGSASQGIIIANDIKEVDKADDMAIIQPYLFPQKNDANYNIIYKAVKAGRFVQFSEISIQLIFTSKSEFAGIFISRNVLKNGVPVYIYTIAPEEFEYLDQIMKFVPICIEKKVKGPVNIQGRITENGLICFEMNMRFTGITGNRAQLGFNEVDFLIKDFLGMPVKLKGYSTNKVGVRQVACTTIPKEDEGHGTKKVYTILGGSGHIGGCFLNALLKTGEYRQVNLICRPRSYDKYKEMYASKNVNVVCSTEAYVQTIYCQSDVVVNFAGALANKSESEMYEAIVFQFHEVQKIIKANVPFVINVSSQSVYSQQEDVIKKEDAGVCLDSVYAFQKYLAEEFFETIRSNSPDAKVISLRLSRVVSENGESFFKQIIKSLMQGERINITNPFNKINLIDVRDVCNVIFYLLRSSENTELPRVINVGGENISLKEYCEKVIRLLPLAADVSNLHLSSDVTVGTTSMINSDFMHSLGWKPKYAIEDIIKYWIKS